MIVYEWNINDQKKCQPFIKRAILLQLEFENKNQVCGYYVVGLYQLMVGRVPTQLVRCLCPVGKASRSHITIKLTLIHLQGSHLHFSFIHKLPITVNLARSDHGSRISKDEAFFIVFFFLNK